MEGSSGAGFPPGSRFCTRSRIRGVEIGGNRSPDLVEQPAGAVAIAPPEYILPVHQVPLEGDLAAAIILILGAGGKAAVLELHEAGQK